MKKNIIFNSMLFVASLLALASCSDSFLDHQPDERTEIDTEDKVISLLKTSYAGSNYGWLCEILSDNFIDNNCPHEPANPNQKTITYFNLNSYERADDEAFRFEPIKSSTGSDSPSDIWEGYYFAIATANHALKYIDEIAAKNGGTMTPKLKAARAEALLSRAYHHFILVNIFSQAYKNPEASKKDIGIPYVKEVEDKVSVNYPRGNVAEVYQNIKEDLEEGLKDVCDTYYDGKEKWHFNVNAAHAFAARFYLFTRDYEKVIEHADFVLGTDRDNMIKTKLMDYSGFDNCTYSSDYANEWKDVKHANNIMLLATHSTAWRHMIGYRYSCNGPALKAITYRSGPTWGWTIVPCASVSGATFYDGNSDHGFTWVKAGEQFEYTDKVARIGYAHIVRREFTMNQLLLERAEAYLLGRHDKENCFLDLWAYEEHRHNLSPDMYTYYLSGGTGLRSLSWSMIDSSVKDDNTRNVGYWANSKNPNCFDNWDFTQNMSSDFIVSSDEVPYMNAINDYRRFETSYEGNRFFDLKRFGIEYSHFVGKEEKEYRLTWNDPRRAVEVPQEVLAAGLEPSQPIKVSEGGVSNQRPASTSSYVVITK